MLAKDAVASVTRWSARDPMGGRIKAVENELSAVDDRTDSKYPDLKGQWRRFGAVPNTFRFDLAFDPGKPFRAEEPPLTPEYQAIYEANIDDGGSSTAGRL
jgi:hypothetical protein